MSRHMRPLSQRLAKIQRTRTRTHAVHTHTPTSTPTPTRFLTKDDEIPECPEPSWSAQTLDYLKEADSRALAVTRNHIADILSVVRRIQKVTADYTADAHQSQHIPTAPPYLSKYWYLEGARPYQSKSPVALITDRLIHHAEILKQNVEDLQVIGYPEGGREHSVGKEAMTSSWAEEKSEKDEQEMAEREAQAQKGRLLAAIEALEQTVKEHQ